MLRWNFHSTADYIKHADVAFVEGFSVKIGWGFFSWFAEFLFYGRNHTRGRTEDKGLMRKRKCPFYIPP
jgi:hypothetical protein